MAHKLYTLSTWDHDRQRWDVEAEADSIFGLRDYYRRYLRGCWARFSLLVRKGRTRIGTRASRLNGDRHE
jgi:hypothetical protein